MPPKKKKSEEDRKREKKEAERKRREKIKENPALRAEAARKEHERYLQRKAKGQIKSIKEMTKREQRSKRKQWRENTRKKRQKTFQQDEMLEEKNEPTLSISTPSVGYFEVNPQSTTSSCASRGRKRVRRDRSSVVRRCKKLEQQLKLEKRKSEKYRKKYYRLSNQMQEKSNSPRSKVNKYLKTKPSLKSIRKKLIFSEVLKSEVHEGYSAARSIEEKRSFYRVIKGHILKKYRQIKYCKSFFKKSVNVKHLVQRRRKSTISFPSLVRRFLENDENSRQCPGKKDCITRNKIKNQKRLLNDTMANLHQKFVAETKFKISYTTFTRLRPFWIIAPHVSKRDTCLCIIHENAELLVNAAHKFSIINETTPTALCKTVCCDIWSEDCLQRTCLNCKSRTIDFDEENLKDDSEIAYLKWISKNIEVENGKIRKKTVKEEFFNTKKEFIEIFKKSLFQYMMHLRNIVHQYRAVKEIKEGLTNEAILIHMDFSENYNCKYGAEPQAVHFGSSRMSITLHTGIMYYLCNDTHELKTESFCTVSSNLRHDASAVWAHLKPIFLKINRKIPQLKTINFLSDSPSNQYRNKKIFYLLSNQIMRYVPTVQKVLWNYSESGHGKGAPDGVGGVLKRTADRIVACAKDIPDLETFVHLLKECQGVEIYTVSDKDILDVDDLLPKNLVPFKGTMKTHQAVWCQEDPAKVYFRHLTCLQCKVGMCTHFSIGSWSGVPPKEKESSLQGQWVAVIYDNNWYPGECVK